MESKEYIDSGILELYVYGALSEEESREVTTQLRKYPEVAQEVVAIEEALDSLASSVAPYNPKELLIQIKQKLGFTGNQSKVIPLEAKRKTAIATYIGWGAAAVLLIGLFLQLNKNQKLRDQITTIQVEKTIIEGENNLIKERADQLATTLKAITQKDILKVNLAGQEVAPEAYASVYWDQDKGTAYIDISGLPKAPEGKVYQMWSLKLNPLTPTSMGLLEGKEIPIYELENPNESQAFGITLEPAGGSKSPTLDQLYTLGVVNTAP